MKNLFYIFILCLLSSCGIFKKSTKSKVIENVEVTTNTNVDTKNDIIDKSIIKVTEKTDTIIKTKEITTKGVVAFHPDSLIKGLKSISNDLVDVSLTIKNGILTTTATIKAMQIPVSFNKVTETQKNVTTKSTTSFAQDQKEKNTTKTVNKETQPAKMGVWFIGLIVVCVLVFALFKFRK